MGNYLNPGNEGFQKTINSEIYVDKTGMLAYTNKVLNTMQGYLCVSRPRRFGKSMAASMLAAYYSRGCESGELFSSFEIADSKDFEKYLNRTSHIQYNDENALSYTISLALYAARNFYTVHREFAGGKGFADLVFVPRKRFPDKPALVVELKWDKNAKGALEQIKRKEYCKSLNEYQGNLLLVGVNYSKKTKEHECMIERTCLMP